MDFDDIWIPRSRYPNLDNGLVKKGDKDPSVEELIPAFQKYIDGMESFCKCLTFRRPGELPDLAKDG